MDYVLRLINRDDTTESELHNFFPTVPNGLPILPRREETLLLDGLFYNIIDVINDYDEKTIIVVARKIS
jgi:hypothetical protein